MMNKPRILLLTHNSGTAFWRVRNPLMMLQDANMIDLVWLPPEAIPFRDRFWIQQFDAIVLHQEWRDESFQLASMAKMYGKRVILSIDDLVNGWKIPRNIMGGQMYRDQHIIDTIKQLMEMADRIIVTQPFLMKELYEHFQIDRDKFRIFPNLPSYDWIGRLLNPNLKSRCFASHRGQLRVGVMSSLAHYELRDEKMDQEDDFQLIVDTAKELKSQKLKWVLPLNDKNSPMVKRMTSVVGEDKVDVVQQVPIQLFPRSYQRLDLDVVAVPLVKNDFNDSKSNIKLLEAAALGVLPIVSESFAYDGFIDKKWCFKEPKELAQKIMDVKSFTSDKYQSLIEENYRRFYEGQTDYYDVKLNGYFLDNNLTMARETFFGPDKNAGFEEIVPPKNLVQPEAK